MAYGKAGRYGPEALLSKVSTGLVQDSLLPVNVYLPGTTTLASLWTSAAKTSSASNPVSTDGNGNLAFYADPGYYDLNFTPVGGAATTISNILVPVDPTDGTPGTLGNGTYQQLAVPAAVQALTASGALAVSANSKAATAMRPWWTALANRFHTPANVLYIGTSITEGAGNTTAADRWVWRLKDAIRNRCPVPGVTGGVGYIPAWYTSGSFQPYTSVGTLAFVTNDFGLGGREVNWGTTNSITYTVAGTSVDILYVIGGGGVLGYSIDGGAVVNINQAGSLVDNGKTHVSLGAAGTHTIKFTAVSGNVFLDGLFVYNGDESAGTYFWEAGHAGWKASDFVSTCVTPGYFASQLGYVNPALVTIDFGTNEYAGGIASATAQSNIKTIIDKINLVVTPNPTIVLIANAQRSDNGSAIEPWQNYINTLYTLAGQYANVLVADLSLRLPAVASDTFGLYNGVVHPNDKGGSTMADALATFLLPA